MWERYGFYTIQSLLAIYLSLHYGLTDKYTYLLVGSFTALTYTSPIIGGWVADKFLGQKRAVLLGAVVLFLSYLTLSLADSLHGMIACLAGMAVGTGLFKPNVSSILGRQYKTGDPKRDSGYIIFYLGITTGIILGTILPSKIHGMMGWKPCFLAASIGMVFAFLVFFMGTSYLKIPDYTDVKRNFWTGLLKSLLVLSLFGTISFFVLTYVRIADVFFLLVVALTIGYVFNTMRSESRQQKKRTLSILLLCVISVLFWAFYFQIFLVLTLLITRVVQHTIMGIQFPAPYYVSVESVSMILFGFFVAKLCTKLASRNVAVSTSIKFTLSILVMLVAYGLILMAVGNYHNAHLISPWLILLAYAVIAVAELLLSPVGLSMVTQMASPKSVSTMMGVFFVSLGVGGVLSGKLATVASLNPNHHNIVQLKHEYFHAFSKLTLVLLIGFVVVLLIAAFIKKYTQTQPASLGVDVEDAVLIE